MAASLNRTTLVASADQPDAVTDGKNNYYQTSPTNHYARILHGVNLDGRGYAFPYDDVVPSGATGPDQAGTVFDGSPQLLTVTVGGPGAPADKDKEKDGGKKKEEKKSRKTFDFSAVLKKIMAAIKGVFHK